MNDIERYLVEEIALDHADGHISRREALRRLALMGVAAATASTLLAACDRGSPTATPSPTATATPSPTSPQKPGQALPSEPITFEGPEGRKLQGALANAITPRGAPRRRSSARSASASAAG
jgi:carboxymethylenebutenolidase